MKKIVGTALVAAAAYCYFSPKPASYVIRKAFEQGIATAPPQFHTYQENVIIHRNLPYDSYFTMNTYDLFLNRTNERKPLVIWVHGGAYVGGDKDDVSIYATMLAAHGYAVATMNYALAPEATYPTPLKQCLELYAHVKKHHGQQVDLDQIFIAGDSAGAQIAAQLLLTQLDRQYADDIGIAQQIHVDVIKGAILCCGPYDLAQLHTLSDRKWLAALLTRAGAAYIGERRWQVSETTALASIVGRIPQNFPPTFLTDGNVATFTTHTEALAQELRDKHIPHDVVLYDPAHATLAHEYQFLFDTREAQQTFERLLAFLQRYSD